MKKLLILFSLCAMSCGAEAQTGGYHLSISWPDGDGRMITLAQQQEGGTVVTIDSVTIEHGKATMEGIADAGEYVLNMHGGIKYIWIDEEPSHAVIANDGQAITATITGGVNQTVYQRFHNLASESLVENIRIGSLIRQEAADTVRVAELQREYAANNDGFRAATAELIMANPDLPVSAALLKNTTHGRTDEQIEQLFSALNPKVQSSPFGMAVREAVDLRVRTRAGAEAMDFTLPAPDGTEVNMSDYTGRWILLDFWSSFCAPCLRAAPILRAVQEKYADKLTIVGISLDTESEPWVKAIETYDLNWVQASSLKGWECPVRLHYGVEQMPTMFLIDPSGHIANIPLGLTAEQLDETLSKLI